MKRVMVAAGLMWMVSWGAMADCELQVRAALVNQTVEDRILALLTEGLQKALLSADDIREWSERLQSVDEMSDFHRSVEGKLYERVLTSLVRTSGPELDLGMLQERILGLLGAVKRQAENVDDVVRGTRSSFRHAKFIPVDGTSMEIMDTHVTEWMYSVLAPTRRGRSRTKSDHPMTGLFLDDILEVVERLNAGLSFDEIVKVIPDHQNGDRYGLPTKEIYRAIYHQAFDRVPDLTGHGLVLPPDEIGRHAWTHENSGGVVQAVATLLPVPIAVGGIFDLYGNVGELALESFDAVSVCCRKTSDSFWGSIEQLQKGGILADLCGNNRLNRTATWGPSVGFRLTRERRR